MITYFFIGLIFMAAGVALMVTGYPDLTLFADDLDLQVTARRSARLVFGAGLVSLVVGSLAIVVALI